MHETKRDGYIRRMTNALISDKTKEGIHLTHNAAIEILELLKEQPEPCDGVSNKDVRDIIRRLKNIANHAVHVPGEKPFVLSLDDGIALFDAVEILSQQV